MAEVRPHLTLAGEERIIEAGWDPMPRWPRYSGLPQVLKQTPMDVYERLLARTLASRTLDRPAATPDGQIMMPGAIAFTYDEIGSRIGVSYKTVQRAVGALQQHNLLQILRTGYRLHTGYAEPSWGVLDLQLLEWVYVLSCGSIPREVGGLCEWGRGEERLSVRLWQAAEPIAILRCLGADDRWSEPPVAFLRLLLAAPRHFESLRKQIAATRDLQARVATLELRRVRGVHIEVGDLERRLGELTWRPAELVQAVENLVENVGKTQ